MQLTKLHFKNLLSFKDVSIDLLKGKKNGFNASKFNLFIGPNNEGKSNVLKGIQFSHAIIEALDAYCIDKLSPDNLKNLQWRIDLSKNIMESILKFTKEEQDLFFEQNFENEISFTIGIKLDDDEQKSAFPLIKDLVYNEGKNPVNYDEMKIVEIGCALKKENEDYSIDFKNLSFPYLNNKITGHTNSIIASNQAVSIPPIFNDFFSQVYKNLNVKPCVGVLKAFFSTLENSFSKNVKFIPSVRKIGEFSHGGEDNKKEFGETAKELSRLRDGMHEERKRFMEIKKFIQGLIFPKVNLDKIEITFPWQEKEGCYMLKLNVDDIILPLSQLGSGIEQLIYMAVQILIEKDETIFLIEEPETGFHPKLQRAFIGFLQEEIKDKNHQFFITSHSSVFIDPFLQNENAKVFHVSFQKNDQASKISPLENLSQISDLFFELGIKGVDYLQVNGIIWVEGPSDRLYILKWLEIYRESGKKDYIPKEGRDFSFLFYGGSILSSFGIDVEGNGEFLKKEEDDFINLIKINPNIAVVMDLDSAKGKKWETKKRIEKEIKKLDFGFSWITDGKEIENYLTLENINRAFGNLLKENYKINSKKPFEKFLKNKRFSVGKKEFAKQITDKMVESDLRSNKELLTKIEELYQTIEKWNSI